MLVRALVVASGLWVMAVILAPVAIESRQPVFSLAAAGVYSAGARVCHQRPDRCFRVLGRPMPVCARCTGLYASAALAAPLALFWASRVSSRRARLFAATTALPTVITWGIEVAGLAHPSNTARAIAALPLGFAAAWLVVSTLTHGPRRVEPVGPSQGRMQ